MRNTIIDNYVFAKSRGAVTLRQRSVNRFATSTAVEAGAQVQPESALPFTLELTKYVPANIGQLTVDYHLAQIGKLVFMETNGVRYWNGPYFLKFLVLGVEIMESKAIVRACGTAAGQSFDFAPAWMVVSRWTMQAVAR